MFTGPFIEGKAEAGEMVATPLVGMLKLMVSAKTLSENRQVEQYMGTGQLNQGQPVLRLLGPASAQTATLEEPGDRPLHHPSSRRMRLAVGVRFLGGLVARFG